MLDIHTITWPRDHVEILSLGVAVHLTIAFTALAGYIDGASETRQ